MGDGRHIDGKGLDSLTDTQRAILDALQRPLRDGGPYATPATNREIAAEVFLSVDAVKGHLRAMYARLGIDGLPQNAKRARLAEIGISGAVDHALPPRPPEPVAVAPEARSRRRIPAMLSTVALGLVLLGVVVGLMLGRDGGDTIISQQPGFDQPGEPGKGKGGKRTLLGELPGPWSDDGLFAAGPAVPAGYALTPGTAGAAPVSDRTAKPRRRSTERGEARGERRESSRRPSGSPAPPAAAPAVTTAPTPTRRARRTCTTRRQVTHRPRTVTVRRVRMRPQRVRVRQVRYRQEVRMVPVQRQVPNGNGQHKGNGKKNKNGKGGQGGTHTETVMVRQVRRVPVIRYVTRTRMRRQVRYVKVTRRQRVVRSVRTCR